MTITTRPRWSLGHGKPLVPSGWQATGGPSGTWPRRPGRRTVRRRCPGEPPVTEEPLVDVHGPFDCVGPGGGHARHLVGPTGSLARW